MRCSVVFLSLALAMSSSSAAQDVRLPGAEALALQIERNSRSDLTPAYYDPINWACAQIWKRQWNAEEAARLSRALVARFGEEDHTGDTAWAICSLARRHPEVMQPAIKVLIQSIDMRRIDFGATSPKDAITVIQSLRGAGEAAKPALPALREILKQAKDEKLRYVAIWAASTAIAIDPSAADGVDLLIAELDDDRRCWQALHALNFAGRGAAKAIDPVAKIFADDKMNEVTKLLAASALVSLEEKPRPEVIELLCKMLEEERIEFEVSPTGRYGPSLKSTNTQAWAGAALGRLTVGTEKVLPRLRRLETEGTHAQKIIAREAREQIEAKK